MLFQGPCQPSEVKEVLREIFGGAVPIEVRELREEDTIGGKVLAWRNDGCQDLEEGKPREWRWFGGGHDPV